MSTPDNKAGAATNAGEGNPSAKTALKPVQSKAWEDEDEDDGDDDQEIGVNYNIKLLPVPPTALPATNTAQATSKITGSTSVTTPQRTEEPPNPKVEPREDFKRGGFNEESGDIHSGYQERRYGGRKGFENATQDQQQTTSSTYSGQKDTGERYPPRGGPRNYGGPKPTFQDIDPESNYAKYYERDPNFFLKILEQEEPGEQGHEFKLQLRKNDNYAESTNEELIVFGSQSFDDKIALVLMDYDAENPRTMTHRMGDPQDKHRIMFTIKNKEKAIQFWRDFMLNKSKRIHEGCRHTVFLQKPAELFIRYGDQEAEKYYAEQERLKQEYEQKSSYKVYSGQRQDDQGYYQQNNNLEGISSREQYPDDEKYQGGRQGGKQKYRDNQKQGGGRQHREPRDGSDKRRKYSSNNNKYHQEREIDYEQQNKEAFEELKQSSTNKMISTSERPRFINSKKQQAQNKETQGEEIAASNTTTPSDYQESPVAIMPEEPHRKVIDTSKQAPARTVTDTTITPTATNKGEQKQPRLKKQGSQMQYQPKLTHQVSGNSDYGVEHVQGGNFKFKGGSQHPFDDEGGSSGQYGNQPRRGNGGRGNRQRGRGYGNDFREEDAQLDKDQLEGVAEEQTPQEGLGSSGAGHGRGYAGNKSGRGGGGHRKTEYRRDQNEEGKDSRNTNTGGEERADKSTGGNVYQVKQISGGGRGNRYKGASEAGEDKQYQKSGGNQKQAQDDSGQQRKQREERKGGEGANNRPQTKGEESGTKPGPGKKGHGAVMGPKAGTNQASSGAQGAQNNQKGGKKSDQQKPKTSLGMFGIFASENHLID